MRAYVAAVERTVTLTKTDAETSFGFHLIGRDPMTISTVEPGTRNEQPSFTWGEALISLC